ncbi:MAG: hypothetical protein AAFX56_15300 [Pseudomonadota bacterium]
MTNAVSREVKGGRSAFFENAESDRLLAMLMQLVTEHWALRERALVLETVLVEKGVLSKDELDQYRADEATDADWDAMSFELIQSVIEAGQNIEKA